MTLGAWTAAVVAGRPPPKPERPDAAAAAAYARGAAHRVVAERQAAARRRQAAAPSEKEKKAKEAAVAAATKPLKAFRSLNPLAPVFRPLQRGLLASARKRRVVRAVLGGRDDPVATATAAAALVLGAAACFTYSEVAHPWVVALWDVAKTVATWAFYALGLLLFGPQNWVLARVQGRARCHVENSVEAGRGGRPRPQTWRFGGGGSR